MPELPEVESYRRILERHARGETISAVRVRDAGVLSGVGPRVLDRALRGRSLRRALRHGKIVFADLGPGPWLVLRFGMTGDLVPLGPGDAEPPFARVVLAFRGGKEVAFTDMRKFGSVALAPSPGEYLSAGRVGPDALMVPALLFVARAARRRAPIKAVLLDQGLLAGVGNLYADEALFQAGIHPATPAAELGADSLRRLHAVVRRVLGRALRLQADWSRLPRAWLLRVRDEGGPCPHCGRTLPRATFGGRTAVFCPVRQRPRR